MSEQEEYVLLKVPKEFGEYFNSKEDIVGFIEEQYIEAKADVKAHIDEVRKEAYDKVATELAMIHLHRHPMLEKRLNSYSHYVIDASSYDEIKSLIDKYIGDKAKKLKG